MAKSLEKRSAKVLALILALIMIGSVFAYAMRGSHTIPERKIIYNVKGFKRTLTLLSNSRYVYFLNFNQTDKNMTNLISSYWKSFVMNDPIFRYVRFTKLNSMFYAMFNQTVFGSNYLYLFDAGNSKIFFTYDKEFKYKNVTIKVKDGYGYAENVNPAPIGTLDTVYSFIDKITSKNESGEYGKIISEIPDINYDFAIALFGEMANSSIRMKNSSGEIANFYFEGIAINKSGGYDKVVAVNFLQNVFFVKSNVTEIYNVTRIGGLNIAFMHDSNFTKILEAKPEMRAIIIKWNESGR